MTRVSINPVLLLADRNFCMLNIRMFKFYMAMYVHVYAIVVKADMPMIRLKHKVKLVILLFSKSILAQTISLRVNRYFLAKLLLVSKIIGSFEYQRNTVFLPR